MLTKVPVIALALIASGLTAVADPAEHTPQLLLNAQRVKRLKRDRERQTVRWVNFENRVKTVVDSPERGFELALYYAVAADEARGKEAVAWALAHPRDRQAALVLDWCAPLIGAEEGKRLAACPELDGKMAALRDCLFKQVASDSSPQEQLNLKVKDRLAWFEQGGFRDAAELYALCEYLSVLRASQRVDLREEARSFFSRLPAEFMLSLKPKRLAHPDWMTHVAALALVALDPNLPSSQFLQGWALEEQQMLREGPGVAYELLWADPYLPGVGYQNMDTWLYDSGWLFARSDWETSSCYVEISVKGVQEDNCPPGWRDGAATFGHLTLIPMAQKCVELPHVANNDSVILWKLKPYQKITYGSEKPLHSAAADAAGLWRPGANVEGKACLSNR